MSNQTNLLDLPNEILRNQILSRLSKGDLFLSVGMVCRRLMTLTLDISNVINISLSPSELSSTKIAKAYRIYDSDGYFQTKNQILKEKLKRVLMNNDIAQCVKTFRMKSGKHTISRPEEGIIIAYETFPGHFSFTNSEEYEVLNLVSQICNNLEELHLISLDLEKLQIIAEFCGNLKTLFFEQCSNTIYGSIEEANRNHPDIYNVEYNVNVNGGCYVKGISMNNHSTLNELLCAILRTFSCDFVKTIQLCMGSDPP